MDILQPVGSKQKYYEMFEGKSQSCPFASICCCTVAVVKNLEALVLDHAIHLYLRSTWIAPSFVSILEYVYTVIYILWSDMACRKYTKILLNVEF